MPGAVVTVLLQNFLSLFVSGPLAEIIGAGTGAVVGAASPSQKDAEKGRSDSRYNLIATWRELEQLAPR